MTPNGPGPAPSAAMSALRFASAAVAVSAVADIVTGAARSLLPASMTGGSSKNRGRASGPSARLPSDLARTGGPPFYTRRITPDASTNGTRNSSVSSMLATTTAHSVGSRCLMLLDCQSAAAMCSEKISIGHALRGPRHRAASRAARVPRRTPPGRR
jgi:hypothetical protein